MFQWFSLLFQTICWQLAAKMEFTIIMTDAIQHLYIVNDDYLRAWLLCVCVCVCVWWGPKNGN